MLTVQNHIRIGSVLEDRERQLVNAQNVRVDIPNVLTHLHDRLQNMLRREIAVQAVLEQEKQDVLDEVKVRALLNITIDTDGEVFTEGEDENVKWSQVGAIRAVGVGAVLKENPNAVEIKHLQEHNL